MECPKCQLDIPDNLKFCNECGCHLVEGLDGAENKTKGGRQSL